MAYVKEGYLYNDAGMVIGVIDGSNILNLSSGTVLGTISGKTLTWNAAGKAAGYGGITVLGTESPSTTNPEEGINTPEPSGTTTNYGVPYPWQRMIQEAFGYEGMDYRWSGIGEDGTIDCSGLVVRAFQAVGVNLPHHAQSIFSGYGTRVAYGDARAGDLLFFGGGPNSISHVAIYLGNGMMLEAGDGSRSTSVTKVSHRGNLVGAKRIKLEYSWKGYGAAPAPGQYVDASRRRSSAEAEAASFASSKEAVNDIFQAQLGRDATDAEASLIINGNWSQDHVVRYIRTLAEWGPQAPGYDQLRAEYQAVWNNLMGMTPVPEATMTEWIKKNLTTNQVSERIRAMPEYTTGNEYLTNKYDYIHRWEVRTGRPMSALAEATLTQALKEQWTSSRWDSFIEEQPEYLTGVEYTGKKVVVTDILRDMWGEGVVDAKLAADPDYVENTVWQALGKDADPAVVADWARNQPEWITGPQATTSRVGLQEYWGNIMRTPMTPELTEQVVREGWTKDQLLEHMRGTPEYMAYFAAKPAWFSEEQFIAEKMSFDAVGRNYFRNDAFHYSDAQLTYFFEHGITSEEMGYRYAWTEEATEQLADAKGSWAYYLEAVGITLTADMAYTMASGAEGSGALFAALLKGQNRRSFDEAFTMYNGRPPGAGDYAYLESNFVSATEYAKRVAAVEYSVEVFPKLNEIFMRVYGYEADLGKLQDVAMDAKGSGAYKALISAAEEMDRYTLPWREYARTDPTPQQYAEWSGFAGPSELEKLLRARELVKANGREIMDIYNAYWVMQGAPPITEADIFTLEGQYQGWGAIGARLQTASEHRQRQDAARQQWLASPTAQAYTVTTQFGGPQTPFLRRPQG